MVRLNVQNSIAEHYNGDSMSKCTKHSKHISDHKCIWTIYIFDIEWNIMINQWEILSKNRLPDKFSTVEGKRSNGIAISGAIFSEKISDNPFRKKNKHLPRDPGVVLFRRPSWDFETLRRLSFDG